MGAFWPHPLDTKLFWKERTHIWLQSMSLPDLKSKESTYGRHRGVVFFLDSLDYASHFQACYYGRRMMEKRNMGMGMKVRETDS